MELKNKCWTEEQLFDMRRQILTAWPTGSEVDLEDAVRYQGALPEHRRFAAVLKNAKSQGRTLVQPRAGVALIDEHIELLTYLAKEGGADCLPTTIDSYTRQNRYQEAAKGIEESRTSGRSLLNGFPAVNHGLAGCRRVVESVEVPVQVRHGTPDARLLAEITLAGGFTDYEGGGISYNIPYAKDVPLEQTIHNWQYVDRLVGWYQSQGIQINREPFGPLTGTLVPPCISHTVAILEALLAAEQGVRHLTLGYGQSGNLFQDVAAIATLEQLANEFLGAGGFDIQVTTVFHQWMGGFPQDEAKAFGVIGSGAVVGALAGATKIIVKTPHEAYGIPTKEANAQGLKTTKQVVNMLRDQPRLVNQAIWNEMEIITKETRCIMDAVRNLGAGDWAQGAVRAFAGGVLDVPFAPSRYNQGRLLPARDNHGAIRLLDAGSLPFTEDLLTFHRDMLEERGRAEGREPSFQMVIDDIYAISKGMLVGRPS